MSTSQPFHKATNAKQIKRVTEMSHLASKDDPRYVSLDEIRGDNIRAVLTKTLYTDVEGGQSTPAHIIYAGHRGNGKTTELCAFMDNAEQEGYFFVYKQAYVDLAIKDLDYTDIMLYLARTAVEGLCLQGVPVEDALLEPIEAWFRKETNTKKDSYKSTAALVSKVSAGLTIPGLLKLLTSFSGKISGGHESVRQIRADLARSPSELIHYLNLLFMHLRTALANAGKSTQLVLVLDNLDRHLPSIMDNAFSQWAPQFSQLNVHMIITMPIGLIYNPQGERVIDSNFYTLILPMPKVRLREHALESDQYWSKGVKALISVIQARVNEESVFAGTATTRQRNMRKLVLASGGSLRELMRLLHWAGMEAWDQPITAKHVDKAIHLCREEFMENFQFSDIPILEEIHALKRADHREEVGRQLFYRFALEYNGERWADVHPLVFMSDRYKTVRPSNDDNDQ